MKTAERTRQGCRACRQRHAKCDDLVPACRRCQRRGLDCVRSNPIRFAPLKGVPDVASRHASQNKTKELQFIDESSRLADSYELGREQSVSPVCEPQNHRRKELHSPSSRESNRVPILDHNCSSTPLSNCEDFAPDLPQATQLYRITELPSPSFSWCLENENEVQLLRHYVDVISTWFDTCDAERCFGVLVPRLIPSFPPLLKAILAVSARHVGILTGRNVLSADRYNQECLSSLIPLFNDDSAVTDDVLLAVIVILRLSEELEAPIVRADSPGHMLGIRQFVRAQGRLAHSSKLRYAALSVMVRQENYLALMNMCSIGWDLDDFEIPSSPDSTDEFSWSMFILRHCSNIIQLCHEESSRKKRDCWEEMKRVNESWLVCKPASFAPVLATAPNRLIGEPFPREWFVQGWHATAMQHYYLNLVLLALSDPYIPQFGLGHMEAKRKSENDILKFMRHLCGIAVASQIQPCLVTAYMSISMCGDRFMDRLEQEKIIELLVQVNKQCGWPTIKVQQQLRKAWVWE